MSPDEVTQGAVGLAAELRHDVTVLAVDIGERNIWLPEKLDYARMALVVEALARAVRGIVDAVPGKDEGR